MNSERVAVYLGLGSNIGDRRKNLERAMEMLSQRLKVVGVSSVYDTAPLGNTDQPRFFNMVCQAYTRLMPQVLLTLAKGIESKLGRMGKTNEPRPIDIDILFYEDQIIETPELVVPHPRLAERAFVLVPLAEIAPGLIHPVLGKSITDILHGLNGVQGVVKLENA